MKTEMQPCSCIFLGLFPPPSNVTALLTTRILSIFLKKMALLVVIHYTVSCKVGYLLYCFIALPFLMCNLPINQILRLGGWQSQTGPSRL